MVVDMSFEATTVLLVWTSHLLLTPFVLSRDTRIALIALALLAVSGATLMWTRQVNLMLYTHYVPGTSALVIGRSVICGDGGAIVTASLVGPAIIFTIEVCLMRRATNAIALPVTRADARPERSESQGFISQYLAYKVYGPHFYSLSHNLLHLVAAGWMASFLADHVCAWCRPSRLPTLRVARLVHDPAVMVCLGVLMIGHQHDTTPIGEFFHDLWGTAFIAMGLLHLFSSMIHATHARHARLSMLARALHACASGPNLCTPEPACPYHALTAKSGACAGTRGSSTACGRASWDCG